MRVPFGSVEVKHEVVLPDGNTVWALALVGSGGDIGTVVGLKLGWEDIARLAPVGGLVLEFGVARGHSLRNLARVFPERRVYGFDSWTGLPHDWEEGDRRGSFACEVPVDLPANVTLVAGRFGVSLEPFLVSHADDCALVHIDSDLYCSCAYVLDVVADRLVGGSVVMFDEIGQSPNLHGERRAWNRHRALCGGDWELVGKQHAWGEVWIMR